MDESENYETFFATANYLSVTADLPIEIVPGHIFDRANAKEIDVITARLHEIDLGEILISLYSGKFEARENGGNKSDSQSTPKMLAAHYFVIRIALEKDETEMDELRCASHAMPQNGLETFLSQTTLNGEFFRTSYPTYLDLLKFHTPLPTVLNPEYFRLFSETFARLQAAKTTYPSIYRSFTMFDDLRAVPQWSSMFVLGLFSVIESLLTHAPDPKDPTDSLTRQIVSKARLLNNRFSENINIAETFGTMQKGTADAKHKAAWKALYGYRSSIAHGSPTRSEEMAILKDTKTANDFLYKFTKALLRHALEEPVLLLDLQAC
jgi:hypothetical protein